MKEYKEVKVEAKNAPTGSYVAGCPSLNRGKWDSGDYSCKNCERTE